MDPTGTYHGDSDLQLERVNVYFNEASGGEPQLAHMCVIVPAFGLALKPCLLWWASSGRLQPQASAGSMLIMETGLFLTTPKINRLLGIGHLQQSHVRLCLTGCWCLLQAATCPVPSSWTW